MASLFFSSPPCGGGKGGGIITGVPVGGGKGRGSNFGISKELIGFKADHLDSSSTKHIMKYQIF